MTGLTLEKFDELHGVFIKYYKPRGFNKLSGQEATLNDTREALFFVLFSLKVYTPLKPLGFFFGFSDKTAFDNRKMLLPFLKASLAEKKAMANDVFTNQEAFDKAFEGIEDIYIDGTEIPIQRSDNQELQRKDFSGKKNFTH